MPPNLLFIASLTAIRAIRELPLLSYSGNSRIATTQLPPVTGRSRRTYSAFAFQVAACKCYSPLSCGKVLTVPCSLVRRKNGYFSWSSPLIMPNYITGYKYCQVFCDIICGRMISAPTRQRMSDNRFQTIGVAKPQINICAAGTPII